MSPKTTVKELKNMQVEDLRREERAKRNEVAKLHMGITLGKEKDTAKYKREKKHIARIKTIAAEKRQSELQEKAKDTTVSPPAKAEQSSSKKS